ncbi:MAG: peptide deformylase [Erysipelotrichaceae bacterium]
MYINVEDIILDDNSLLREKSARVALPLSVQDKEILLKMVEYVSDSTDDELAQERHLKPAVGLAAPQIGILKQMLAVVIHEEDKVIKYALVNPKVLSHSVMNSYLENGEGCLSVINSHPGFVKRHYKIKIKAYDLLQDKEVIINAKDFLSIVLQHEMDHLNGVLFYDHIDKENPLKPIENSVVI